jgi:hypothetical protein
MGEFDVLARISRDIEPPHRITAPITTLRQSTPSHLGKDHCSHMAESFMLGGDHICFVIELLGPDMNSLRRLRSQHALPLANVKKVAKDVLFALDFLHAECGVYHCGPCWLRCAACNC